MMRTGIIAVVLGAWVAAASRTEAQEAAQAGTAGEARAILKNACYRCHGEDGTVEGGFSYVLDRGQLVARKQIVPGAAAQSKLIRRIRSGEMPPEGESPQLTKEQIDLLARWVDGGAKDFNAPKARRTFVTLAAMLKIMHDDLMERDEADRKFTRYLTLTHLYNAGRSEDELQSFRHGITKLVNSLSWGRKIAVPVSIGSPPTLLRIDLRDYKWSAAVWDKLAAADPYGLTHADPDSRELCSAAGCSLPYVRGDWFVAAASRPPLYHEILQLPQTEKDLETLLHVDVEENVRTGQAARAGFNGSAVSRNNRLIERHDSSYGYYWKSYDFAGNVDRRNLFAHPLGPGAPANYFKHDGGELIFSLPNGLQGYLLVNGEGGRIDKGPTEIVSDPKQPDRAVENGLSCMSCHHRGLLPKVDQIRPHIEKNPDAFSKKEVEAALALYPTRERFQTLIEGDAERFRNALQEAGMPASISEPIQALATLFEAELDLPLAAAEANLLPDEFQERLEKSTTLARTLGSLQTPGGTVQRETYANAYATIARTFKLGSPAPKPRVQTADDDAEEKPRPRKKLVIKLSEDAPTSWLLKDIRKGANIFSDRDYKFKLLPREMSACKYLLRDSEQAKGWLPEGLTATGYGSVFAVMRWKIQGKEELTEVDFAKLEREGWTEVKGVLETTYPGGEQWKWRVFKKEIDEGEVLLQLETLNWGRRVVVFAFK